MESNTSKIRDALAALDPSNDGHWTSQGQPKMEVVCEILGSTVTRAQVNEAAPGFCRTDLAIPADEEAAPGMARAASAFEPALPEAAADIDDDPDARLVARANTRAAAERVLDGKVAELEAQKRAHLDRMIAAKKEADAIDRQIAELRGDFNLEFPPLTEAENYKLIVRRSQEDRQRRADNERAARAVLGQSSKSPLDRALAARRGFGMQRPSYPTGGR